MTEPRFVEPPSSQAVNASFDMGLQAYGRVYLRASMRNLPAVARMPTAAALSGALRGVPAVLVAAGPSLDRNVAQLHRFKGRALIVAINQSLRALRAAGIEPDVVLAVDALNMAYHFEGKPARVLGVCPSVHREVLPLGESAFTFPASHAVESWIYQAMGQPVPWGAGNSVAHHAYHLALCLGCSPIVVVGQDFALNGTQYYASNAGDGGARLVEDGGTLSTRDMYDRAAFARGDEEHARAVAIPDAKQLMRAPGWGGGEVVTTSDLYPQLELYGRIVREAAAKGARTLNCTEGGAHIDGAEEMRMADVVLGAPETMPGEVVASMLADPSSRADAMRKSLKGMRKNLQHLGQLADSLLSRTERGPSRARQEFAKAAADCEFFQLWCLRELRAMKYSSGAHQVQLVHIERNLYAATKLLCEDLGERLRQAATGLASANASPSFQSQVMTKDLSPLA